MPMSTTERPRVVVLGSANVDVSLRVETLPKPGETVSATRSTQGPGGKGANQAVAVGRAGVPVTLLATIGDDRAGTELTEAISGYGVDTSHIRVRHGVETGRAHVTVDRFGENSIVVFPGANAFTAQDYVAATRDVIAAADVLVVQGEIPVGATQAAIRIADGNGTRVIANPAPYVDLEDCTSIADPLVLNSVEATQLIGRPIQDADDVRQQSAALMERARSVLVTLGAAGAVLCTHDSVLEVPASPPAAVIDTTGAGDALVGVLAAALALGYDLERACSSAVAAATSTVESAGAAAGYPLFSLTDPAAEVIA